MNKVVMEVAVEDFKTQLRKLDLPKLERIRVEAMFVLTVARMQIAFIMAPVEDDPVAEARRIANAS